MEPSFHAQEIGQGHLPANALQLVILRNEAALVSILLKEKSLMGNDLISFISFRNKKLCSGRRVPFGSQAILHSKGHSFSPRSFIYDSGSPPKPTKESAFFLFLLFSPSSHELLLSHRRFV